jgi:hypothetical protein
MNLFRQHINDKEHPFNIISKHFSKVFCIYIQGTIKELYNLKNINSPDFNTICNAKTEAVVYLVQKFIIKLQTGLRLMYCKTLNYTCFIEEKDEFINLVTSLVIKEGKLYDNLFELFKIGLYDQIKILESNFNDYKNVRPEELGIHDKFCLNERTIAYQKKLVDENQQNLNTLKKKEEDNNLNLKTVNDR